MTNRVKKRQVGRLRYGYIGVDFSARYGYLTYQLLIAGVVQW